MAKKLCTILVDDLDGSEAQESIEFCFDGVQYEIDLSSEHAAEMRNAFQRYIDAGTRVTRRARRRPSGSGLTPEELQRIREWAGRKGYNVAQRGRIKQTIIDEYNQEHGNI